MQEIWVQSPGSDKLCLCSTVAKSTDSGARQVLFEFWLCCCSITKLCLIFCNPMGCRLPCPSLSPGACSNSCPLSQWCYPTILFSVIPFSSCLQSFPASGSFPMSWLCIKWPNYWSFSFSISPSNEYSGLISFRIDWLDLLPVQGSLKSFLQHHNSKPSILQCLAFFSVQLSHPYLTTGKIIALTRQTFVGKVMSLLFNMLSRLIIAFLPTHVF